VHVTIILIDSTVADLNRFLGSRI